MALDHLPLSRVMETHKNCKQQSTYGYGWRLVRDVGSLRLMAVIKILVGWRHRSAKNYCSPLLDKKYKKSNYNQPGGWDEWDPLGARRGNGSDHITPAFHFGPSAEWCSFTAVIPLHRVLKRKKLKALKQQSTSGRRYVGAT